MCSDGPLVQGRKGRNVVKMRGGMPSFRLMHWWHGASLSTRIKVKQSHHGLDRPLGFQEVEAPRFLDIRHMKVLGCQHYAAAAFTPQERSLVLISARG
jgi:hypothetical protein